MSSKPFPDKDHWQKTADRYLDVARASAARTSAIAISWLVVIIISVYSYSDIVEIKKQEIKNIVEKFIAASSEDRKLVQEQKNLNEEIENFKRSCKEQEEIGSKLLEVPIYSCEKKNTKIQKFKDKFEENKILEKKNKKELDEAKRQIEAIRLIYVPLQFPTLPSFNVKLSHAPILLNIIVLGLAIYVTLMRARTFNYLSMSLRILKGKLAKSMEAIGDVLSPRNWWMLPLPKKSGTLVSKEDLAIALGWRGSLQTIPFLSIIFWLILLITQFYLTTSSVTMQMDLLSSHSLRLETNMREEYIRSVINVMLLAITFLLFVRWFRPSVVPDNIPNPVKEIKEERRRFLVYFGTGATFSLAFNSVTLQKFLSKVIPLLLSSKPRFRKREPFVSVKSYQPKELLLYPFTKLVYVVNCRKNTINCRKDVVSCGKNDCYLVATRQSNLPKEFDLSLMGQLEPSKLVDDSIRINCSIGSISYEFAAKALFDKNQSENAFKVLLIGVKQDLAYKQHAKLFRGSNGHRTKPKKKKQNLSTTAIGQLNSNEIPTVSIRLYDLFAKEAVRNKQPELIKQQLIPFINANKLASVFEHRITKWTNPESKWYRDVMKYGPRSSNVG